MGARAPSCHRAEYTVYLPTQEHATSTRSTSNHFHFQDYICPEAVEAQSPEYATNGSNGSPPDPIDPTLAIPIPPSQSRLNGRKLSKRSRSTLTEPDSGSGRSTRSTFIAFDRVEVFVLLAHAQPAPPDLSILSIITILSILYLHSSLRPHLAPRNALIRLVTLKWEANLRYRRETMRGRVVNTNVEITEKKDRC